MQNGPSGQTGHSYVLQYGADPAISDSLAERQRVFHWQFVKKMDSGFCVAP